MRHIVGGRRPIRAWTDYPITELGDLPGREAPIRRCLVLTYDRNKYVEVEVGGVHKEIKAGYVTRKWGRCGETPSLTRRTLLTLPEPVEMHRLSLAQKQAVVALRRDGSVVAKGKVRAMTLKRLAALGYGAFIVICGDRVLRPFFPRP